MGLVGIKPKKASQNTSLQQKNLHYWAYLKHIGNTDVYYVYYIYHPPPALQSLQNAQANQTKLRSKSQYSASVSLSIYISICIHCTRSLMKEKIDFLFSESLQNMSKLSN